jgi:hypothetical protein
MAEDGRASGKSANVSYSSTPEATASGIVNGVTYSSESQGIMSGKLILVTYHLVFDEKVQRLQGQTIKHKLGVQGQFLKTGRKAG